MKTERASHYLEHLRQQNGICSCPAMNDLNEQDLNTISLKRDLDEDSATAIAQIGEIYSSEERFYELANRALQEGRLVLFAHDPENFCALGEIPSAAINRFVGKYDSPITAHCVSCYQQILVLETSKP
jgi:hypothetical protein